MYFLQAKVPHPHLHDFVRLSPQMHISGSCLLALSYLLHKLSIALLRPRNGSWKRDEHNIRVRESYFIGCKREYDFDAGGCQSCPAAGVFSTESYLGTFWCSVSVSDRRKFERLTTQIRSWKNGVCKCPIHGEKKQTNLRGRWAKAWSSRPDEFRERHMSKHQS